MNLISLSNHTIRKALRLSLNEMAVLCDIFQMSNNPKFDYWCVKSKEQMAKWLDLHRETIFNALNALEAKGYIERKDGKCRPSQGMRDIEAAQDEISIIIQSGDEVLLSAKMKEIGGVGNSDPSEISTDTVGKTDWGSRKNRRQPSENPTQDIHRNTERETERVYAFSDMVACINQHTGKSYRGDKKAEAQFRARLRDGWTKELFEAAIQCAAADPHHIKNDYKWLTPELLTRSDKLNMFANREVVSVKKPVIIEGDKW